MKDIWKEMAVEELTLYSAKVEATRTIPERIRELEIAFGSLGSPSADKIAVQGGDRGDKALNNIVQREQLVKNLTEAKVFVSRVNRGLETLTRSERDILERFYIKPEQNVAENIAREKGRDKQTVYRWKDNALFKFKTAMYG